MCVCVCEGGWEAGDLHVPAWPGCFIGWGVLVPGHPPQKSRHEDDEKKIPHFLILAVATNILAELRRPKEERAKGMKLH